MECEVITVMNYTMQIVSHSQPQGGAPYVVTLNYFVQDGSKRYETSEELRRDLIAYVSDTSDAGLDAVLYDVKRDGFTTIQVSLSQENAQRLGLRR
jgi:hypothetical protein